MWLHREGFRETLRNWWNGISMEGNLCFYEEIKGAKRLEHDMFGNLIVNKIDTLRLVNHWD